MRVLVKENLLPRLGEHGVVYHGSYTEYTHPDSYPKFVDITVYLGVLSRLLDTVRQVESVGAVESARQASILGALKV